jgi:predicted nucleic acid-binding protein
MNLGSRGPVVIDTGVFGARLAPSGRLLAARYRPILEGRPAVVSFVTVAELEYGARLADWGPDRLRRLEYEIGRAEIVWPGPHLTEVCATLRAWCVRTGHGWAFSATRLVVPQSTRSTWPSSAK